MGYRSTDPRWVEAPVETTCARCGAPIHKGARAFFYPHSGEALCNTPTCGHAADMLVQQQIEQER